MLQCANRFWIVRLGGLGVATALLMTTIVPPASAQEAMKLAVIDVGRILEESHAGKEAIGALQKMQEDKKTEGEVLQEQAKLLDKQIKEGQLSLSPERLAELQKQLENKVIALQRFKSDADREFAEARTSSLLKIEGEIMPIIRQVGLEEGFTMIFNKFQSGLVFADDEVDITDRVLARFDESPAPTG